MAPFLLTIDRLCSATGNSTPGDGATQMSTTSRRRLQRGRLSQLPTCRHCGNPIRISSHRPRQFCGAKCRQAHYRDQFRNAADPRGPAVPDQFRDAPSGLGSAAIPAKIQHLLGSGARWNRGVALDRETLRNIVWAELGGFEERVESSDGVVSFVCEPNRISSGISIKNSNSADGPAAEKADALPGAGAVNSVE
jgi:hypothetical protein